MDDTSKTTSHNLVAGGEPSVFNFFGLPRELRDIIYSHMNLDVEICSGVGRNGEYNGFKIVVRNTPSVNHLLLSRQFRDEYKHSNSNKQILLIQDMGAVLYTPNLGDLHLNVNTISSAEMYVIASDPVTVKSQRTSRIVIDLDSHFSWISATLKKLPVVQDAKVVVDVYSEATSRQEWLKESTSEDVFEGVKKLTELSKLGCIELYPNCWPDGEIMLNPENQAEIRKYRQGYVVRWTKESGWDNID